MARSILITGCSSGIGYVCALGLKQRGWRVFATARNPEDVAHARIYSRVLEMCTPVHVPGHDRRTTIGKTKQELVKEVLF